METPKKGKMFSGSNTNIFRIGAKNYYASSKCISFIKSKPLDELFMNLQKSLFLYLVAMETAKKGKIFGGSNAYFLRLGSNNNCAEFHAFMKMCTIDPIFDQNLLDYRGNYDLWPAPFPKVLIGVQ